MASPVVYQLGNEAIKDHVFSYDRKILAITKENYVEIYQVPVTANGRPTLLAVLKGHDKTVTSVDISPDGSKILTCSQDRNALVWEYSQRDQEYKPTLVLLRISMAATVCRWSPVGNKFAVGSSNKVVAICYYEEENDWWISKHLKEPFKSTITSLDWHPNNVLLVCGCASGHVNVLSAYIKGLDVKPEPTFWGSKLPFHTLCADFTNESNSWVHDVAFSTDGEAIAFVCHDSSLCVVYPGGEGLPPRAFFSIKANSLPFRSLAFLNPSRIVVGGHNCNLVVFDGNELGWKESFSVENQKDLIKDAPQHNDPEGEEEISSHAALNMFRQLDLKGSLGQSKKGEGKILHTIHQNTIASVRWYSNNQISTSGIDGKVVVFTI